MRKILLPIVMATTLAAPTAFATTFGDSVKQAMQSDVRTDNEKQRDKNRKPVETLEFFGLTENSKVLELVPGGGWYTKLLAPALRDKGELYVSLGTSRLKENLLNQAPFDKVKAVGPENYAMENLDFNVTNVDAVLTFRNYHNFNDAERANMNKAAFNALKPGGIYGVVDHTRRHMQKRNDENGRRVDPVLAIKEIQAAGFVFVDYSPLHYKADDELRFEVGRKSVSGNSDRFTFMFKKPE